MALQEGDFVKIDFTGSISETQEVFDTTKKDVAQEHNIQTQKVDYEPITICIGQGHVLPGLDKALVGKKEQEEFEVKLAPEDAFGKKDAKSIKLMPKKVFDKQQIRVQPGAQVTIDDMPATIKSISGNRVVVDFNHQLAGHELTYQIHTHKKVTDKKTQVETIVENTLRAPADVTIKETSATVKFPIELPKKIQEKLTELITETTDITDVTYETKQNA